MAFTVILNGPSSTASPRVRPITPDFVEQLPQYLGEIGLNAELVDGTDAEGWQTVVLKFEYLEEARAKLLGLGGAVEVLEPLALRLSMADFATQIRKIYEEG